MRGAAPVLMSASMRTYSTVTGTSAAQAITLLSWSLSCQDYSAAITSSSPSLRHVGHVWQCLTILLWEDSMIIDRQTNCLHTKLCNLSAPQHRYRQLLNRVSYDIVIIKHRVHVWSSASILQSVVGAPINNVTKNQDTIKHFYCSLEMNYSWEIVLKLETYFAN